MQPDKLTLSHPGECSYESGDVSRPAENKAKERVVLLNFEVLPAGWEESFTVPIDRK